jgi:hypothetical protein
MMKAIHTWLIVLGLFLSGSALWAQDTILLTSGEEIAARVTEVGTDRISYKRFSNLDGPVYVIEKHKVFMIRYQNGEKEVFNEEKITAKGNSNVIPPMSRVYVFNRDELRSKSMTLGQLVPFIVSEDLVVNDKVIVPKNAVLTGKVTLLEQPRFLGRPGKMEIRIMDYTDPETGLTLSFGNNIYQAGKDKSTEVIILGAIVFWPILFVKGGEVVIAQETPMFVEVISSRY